jgi:hypothetical protein
VTRHLRRVIPPSTCHSSLFFPFLGEPQTRGGVRQTTDKAEARRAAGGALPFMSATHSLALQLPIRGGVCVPPSFAGLYLSRWFVSGCLLSKGAQTCQTTARPIPPVIRWESVASDDLPTISPLAIALIWAVTPASSRRRSPDESGRYAQTRTARPAASHGAQHPQRPLEVTEPQAESSQKTSRLSPVFMGFPGQALREIPPTHHNQIPSSAQTCLRVAGQTCRTVAYLRSNHQRYRGSAGLRSPSCACRHSPTSANDI